MDGCGCGGVSCGGGSGGDGVSCGGGGGDDGGVDDGGGGCTLFQCSPTNITPEHVTVLFSLLSFCLFFSKPLGSKSSLGRVSVLSNVLN